MLIFVSVRIVAIFRKQRVTKEIALFSFSILNCFSAMLIIGKLPPPIVILSSLPGVM